ncbi:MAG: PAS domain S-box protein, partial [Planctomycetota bacterium]
VASNEEMQSTNEELQSVNEELYTVNHEYQRKIGELTELTDDMNNLFELTEVGVIYLDRQLRVRRFTPRIAQTFSLMPQDIGRPISNFAHNIDDETVFEELDKVVNEEQEVEREVKDRQGNHWLMKIMPYRSQLQIEGVILTLIDINSVKETDARLQEYKNIIDSTVEAIIGTDLQGNITSWNPGAAEFYGYSQQEAIGKHVSMLSSESEIEVVNQVLEDVGQGKAIRDLQVIRISKNGERKHVVLAVSPVYDAGGEISGISSISHDFTAQKKAEEKQAKLASIVQQTSDFVGSCDLDGGTITINPAGRRMLGLPDDYDVEGKSIVNWHTREMAKQIAEEAIPEAMQKGLWNGRTDIVSRDGKTVPLSSVIIAHKDEFGNVEYLSKIGRDITQELEFENELREREKFLRKTLDGLSAFAGVLQPDGTLIEANQSALQAAGLKPEDVLGQPLHETFWGSYSVDIQNQLADAIARASQGETVRYDVPIRIGNGQLMIIDFQLKPLRNKNDIITHLILSGNNITERVESESKSRVFRHAFESSLTAMVITDPTKEDNPIIYVNPGFEKLTGYSVEESVGRNCRFLQGPETDKSTVRKLRKAIKRGEFCQVKLLNYKKNGKAFWNELVITPVRDEKGELSHFIGIQFDMTQHQRAESKLSQARDVAEAANQAKSAFVANMSHEIRTPLTTIVGMTEVLLDQETEKERHDTLQLIYQSGRHLITLVNDILDMSKIEAGKLEADLVDASPVQMIEDVADTMKYRAREKGLVFDVIYQGQFPDLIRIDPVRFRQVLFNLTGNAIKFTEQGSVTVECKIIDLNSRPKLQIKVKDTGIGFRPFEMQKLFEQFTQVDSSPTRRKGGTGLGLYISRRLVELMGGSLTAKSEPNQGSCFTLRIPTGELGDRKMMNPAVESKQTFRQPDKQKQSDVSLPMRILVVEDTRGIQRLLQRMLESGGAEVEVADDGQFALELFSPDSNREAKFDLILLDMHMPRVSGYETAAKLREYGIDTPIIALTASAMRGDREKCLDAGCDDYLTKPIDRQKLFEKVAKLVRTRQ